MKEANRPIEAGQTFPPRLRLRTSAEFQLVFRRRCSVSDGTLIVYAAENQLGFSRLGLSISRKVGNAVVRNRWKRHIREAFRRHQTQLPSGFDFVVLPHKSATPSADSVASSLAGLAKRVVKKIVRSPSKTKPSRPGNSNFGRGRNKK